MIWIRVAAGETGKPRRSLLRPTAADISLSSCTASTCALAAPQQPESGCRAKVCGIRGVARRRSSMSWDGRLGNRGVEPALLHCHDSRSDRLQLRIGPVLAESGMPPTPKRWLHRGDAQIHVLSVPTARDRAGLARPACGCGGHTGGLS